VENDYSHCGLCRGRLPGTEVREEPVCNDSFDGMLCGFTFALHVWFLLSLKKITKGVFFSSEDDFTEDEGSEEETEDMPSANNDVLVLQALQLPSPASIRQMSQAEALQTL